MGDFIELLIFLAVVFFTLLAGGRKKRAGTGAQAGRPPRPRPRPETRPTRERREWDPPRTEPGAIGAPSRGAPPERRPAEPQPLPTREGLTRDILELLGAQLPEPAVETQLEAAPPWAAEAQSPRQVDIEAQSLESLEAAGGRDHDLFHKRYVDAPQEPTERETPRASLRRLTPKTARQAVIWKTILSPPKGWD